MNINDLKLAAIAAAQQGEADPTKTYAAMGFFTHNTGGGCMALAYFDDDENHILITDTNGDGIPATMADVMIGQYNSDGDPVGEVWEAAWTK